MQMNWNLLINYLKEPNIQRVALCFVINYHGFAFIARRRFKDYLAGCYELPEGILNAGEDVAAGARRILKESYNVDLKAISHYLGEFDYVSANENRTQMFCFVVTVQNPAKIKVKRNDHGTWMQLSELQSWPIITYFRDFLVKFWLGEGFDPNLSRALIEQAKREDIWRYKVRVIPFRKGEVLLLKRARRHQVLPLHYEFPGKEITHNQDVDSAIISCMTEQTGWAPGDVTGFVGFYDYRSEASRGMVRELVYSVIAQDKPVRLAEHAYSAWIKESHPKKMACTPSALSALSRFADKCFVNVPDEIDVLPAVYYDSVIEELTTEKRRYLDAMAKLQTTGEVDVEALRGHELIKAAFSPEMQKELGL